MALAGVGIWTLAASCKAWYDDGSENTSAAGKTGCVIGALSTLMIVSGAGVAAAIWGSRVGLTLAILNQHTNVKRDLASPEVTQILIDYQTTMVNASRSTGLLATFGSGSLRSAGSTGRHAPKSGGIHLRFSCGWRVFGMHAAVGFRKSWLPMRL
jgi:hypothetical protein